METREHPARRQPLATRVLRAVLLPALLMVSCVAATSWYWQGRLASELSFQQTLDVLGATDQPHRARAAAEKCRRFIGSAIDALARVRERVPDAATPIEAILNDVETNAREARR
ncbi:MAG: hypothetical protein KDE27_01850 [Planctomycetes bacterium]|nr:hypothetical protein [Planctomycetota bacterium]